jgi:hypothetical protein
MNSPATTYCLARQHDPAIQQAMNENAKILTFGSDFTLITDRSFNTTVLKK